MSYNYNYESRDSGWRVPYILVAIVGVILMCAIDSCSVSEDRSDNHMVVITDIEGNYVYDEDTKIVYIESVHSNYRDAAHATYRPYVSPSGNYYRYENGKMVELDGEEKGE